MTNHCHLQLSHLRAPLPISDKLLCTYGRCRSVGANSADSLAIGDSQMFCIVLCLFCAALKCSLMMTHNTVTHSNTVRKLIMNTSSSCNTCRLEISHVSEPWNLEICTLLLNYSQGVAATVNGYAPFSTDRRPVITQHFCCCSCAKWLTTTLQPPKFSAIQATSNIPPLRLSTYATQ
jgi:hypothetical protein